MRDDKKEDGNNVPPLFFAPAVVTFSHLLNHDYSQHPESQRLVIDG